METKITYDEGHAHVAAIRVLRHRSGRPPTIEEVAEVLGSTVEIASHRLRALEDRGIITVIESPFEVHLSVRDHMALEKLPVEDTGEDLAEAVESFQKRQEEKASEMMRLFEEGEGDQEKQEKHKNLEQELRQFKKKKNVRKAPWEKGGKD